MSLDSYSYFQASISVVFVIFSIASVKFISLKGSEYTQNLGGLFTILGSCGLLLTGIFFHTNPYLIYLFMSFISAGGALIGATAFTLFPDNN